jgi:hypothetical protein
VERAVARTFLVIACLWIAGVAYVAGITWPVFPLDMPANDPQVRAAYDRAIWSHLVSYALVAVVPAAILIGLGWSLSKRRREAR